MLNEAVYNEASQYFKVCRLRETLLCMMKLSQEESLVKKFEYVKYVKALQERASE